MPTALEPFAATSPSERIETLDVVRGFALHGILLMNILVFGLPFRAYTDPTVDGAVSGLDFGVYFTVELFAEGAMRALFSMLFGAGVVLLTGGAKPKPAGIYYRRQLLLLAFRLVQRFRAAVDGRHPRAVRLGRPIAVFSCATGSPKRLFVLAAVLFGYLATFYTVMFLVLAYLPEQAQGLQARLDAGAALSAAEQEILAVWAELEASFRPPPDILAREALKFQGGYLESFRANALDVLGLYAAFPLFHIWDALACMVLGMALYKTGVLQGTRSPRFFVGLAWPVSPWVWP